MHVTQWRDRHNLTLTDTLFPRGRKRSTKNFPLENLSEIKPGQCWISLDSVPPIRAQESLSMAFDPTLWALGSTRWLIFPFLGKKTICRCGFLNLPPAYRILMVERGFSSFCIILCFSVQTGTVSSLILYGPPVILTGVHSIRQKSHPYFPSMWVLVYLKFLLRWLRDNTLKYLEALLWERFWEV